jgi:hypothetical protein
MSDSSTRRAVLAGAAALPALSVPAIAAGPDPIFAAIERHRQLEAAHISGLSDIFDRDVEAQSNERCSQSFHALGELVAMTPTTPAGCAAVLRYVEDYTRSYREGGLFTDYRDDVKRPASDFLSRIAATLEAANRIPL